MGFFKSLFFDVFDFFNPLSLRFGLLELLILCAIGCCLGCYGFFRWRGYRDFDEDPE